MSHVIILAASRGEGNDYMRSHRDELPRGRAVIATSAAVIDGIVPSKVIVLPGFEKRRDKHSILARLKRTSKRYQAVEWVTIEPEDPRGPLTERAVTVAYRYHALREAGIPEGVDPVIAMASVEITPEDIIEENGSQVVPPPDLVESAKARRRSRCKDCGALHFPEEECAPPNLFGPDL